MISKISNFKGPDDTQEVPDEVLRELYEEDGVDEDGEDGDGDLEKSGSGYNQVNISLLKIYVFFEMPRLSSKIVFCFIFRLIRSLCQYLTMDPFFCQALDRCFCQVKNLE